MNILDIHTHVLPQVPGSALVCIGLKPVTIDDCNWFCAGLHPWDVTDDFDNQLDVLAEILANPRVLAIGECGFDALRGPSHELQEQAFVRQVQLSEQFHKPMVLHVVRDFDSVIRLRRTLKPTQKWLIHGFRGGPVQMNQLYAQGILVSFGLKHNPESLRTVPPERLFLETDGHDTIVQTISLASTLRAATAETIQYRIAQNSTLLLSPRS